MERRQRGIRTKITALLLVVLATAAAAGCADVAGVDATKIGNDVREAIVSANGEVSRASRQPASYAGRGEPVPVAPGDLVAPAQGAARFDPARAADMDVVTVDMGYHFDILGQRSNSLGRVLAGRKPQVVVVALIPKSIERKQRVLGIEFSLEPTRLYDVGDNRYAEFTVDDPQGDIDITIRATLELSRYDLATAKASGDAVALTGAAREALLKNERFVDKDHPAIQEAARRIDEPDEERTVRAIFEFVTEQLEYDTAKAESESGKAYGASNALNIKKGVCVEYTDLFVALCRAKGIPAKYIGGIPTEGESLGKGHAWAEVYLAGYGWVPFDATWGDTGAVSFEKLRPSYIYLSDVRNDEVLSHSDVFTCRYTGLDVEVSHTLAIDSARTAYIGEVRDAVDRSKSELDHLREGLDVSLAALKASEAELNRINERLMATRRELEAIAGGSREEYNRVVSAHNALVASYNERLVSHNQKVAAYKAEVDRYESKRTEVNALVDKYNAIR